MALRKLCETQRFTATETKPSAGYGPARAVLNINRGDNQSTFLRQANVNPSLATSTTDHIKRYQIIEPMLFPLTPILLDFSPTEPVILGINEIGLDKRISAESGDNGLNNQLKEEKSQLNLHLTKLLNVEDLKSFNPHLRYVMPKPVIDITEGNQSFAWMISFKESIKLLWEFSNIMNIQPKVKKDIDFCRKWNNTRKSAILAFSTFSGAEQQYFMQIMSMPEYFDIKKDNSFSKFAGTMDQPQHIRLQVRQRQDRLLAQFGFDRYGRIKSKKAKFHRSWYSSGIYAIRYE